ncbi:MAG: hypothetical protein AAGJ46_10805 [Planctomycetota bacterium]
MTRLLVAQVCLVMLVSAAAVRGQNQWVGNTSTDALDATNWSDGVVPGVGDNVVLREGGSPNGVVDLGAADVEWGNILFNQASVGTTINGTGTLTANVPGGGTAINIRGLESQHPDRLSNINVNFATNAVIEARNTHNLVFNGSAEAYTISAFSGSTITFNGDYIQRGFDGAGEFITGNFSGTEVIFNAGLNLDRPAFFGNLGIRNGVTVEFGPNSVLSRTEGAFGDASNGLGIVNLFNEAAVRLGGDNVLDDSTDLFSRRTKDQGAPTLDLNGYDVILEFIGTPFVDGGSNAAHLFVDYGAESNDPSTFLWAATQQMPGTYDIYNFEIGVDTLQLGGIGSTFWSSADSTTSGGGSPDIEVKKSNITINGIPYAPFDESNTDPYWTLVNPDDPEASRDVQFFNVTQLRGDFNDDGVVNAADYTVWRDNLGGDAAVLNGNGTGLETVVADDYVVWATNFGATAAASAGASIPEPSTLATCVLLPLLAAGRRSAWPARR